ncbi:hypothetical protein K503DRAFT_390683 [Rhizopogon vinicolor AM-OR11-026]|uniref:Heterokaryon incompatibility domain-containing protein n=1 Tax=Rhizopogon vinicolor AM-OR11-026 TaxID=1314800 RepID=A0A1B7MRF1_9AGAM|nr:hypothetical protein K503DRAFT_390683 [Rhizopogon vinicolor AM-OR11-026]
MAPRDLEDAIAQYIFDETPIYLIYIPEMTLVRRDVTLRHFLTVVRDVTEEDIQIQCVELRLSREDVISNVVRKRVRYAIFSHRWLSEGEVTYQEMTDIVQPSDPDSPGFKKLQSFCEVASKHGLTFAWSDTCCIDKTSSSELDESIRSMFKWYRNSSICIAYLAQTVRVADLAKDLWFTRGWTLQELLAPKRLKFFGAGWAPLTMQDNDKADYHVIKMIERTTSISSHELNDFIPGSHDVAKRMTWAANRRTTRGEDMAYSLMGIFNVILPIAYGEGLERAFFRLVEAIIQTSDDLRIFNWAGRPAVTNHPSRALPSSPRCYVGQPYCPPIRREFSLTNSGLRIKLLILPAELASRTHDHVSPRQASFQSEIDGVSITDISVTGDFLSYGDPVQDATADVDSIVSDYAFGVWNYVETPSGDPVLPRNCLAFMLMRTVEPVPVMSSNYHWSKNPWRKHSTTSFVKFQTEFSPHHICPPLKRFIEHVSI